MKTNKSKISLLAVPFLMIAGLAFSGCGGSANSAATCSFVMGDGETDSNGTPHDSRIHEVHFPGDTYSVGGKEIYRNFPCNARTFIVNPKDERNGNGDPVGDRHTPVYAYTSDGTKVKVWLTAYWTLNQNPKVLKDEFAPVCLKFVCWSGDEGSNNVNFASKGWNGMLGETLSKGIDKTVVVAAHGFTDEQLFIGHDPAEIKKFADKLSEGFNDGVRPTTGAASDLFCGSGSTSGWPDPAKPGKGEFQCGNVRFVVDDVKPADPKLEEQVADITGKDAKIKANQEQKEIATAKYGPQASYWLGLQDLAKQCSIKCSIVVGDPPTSGQ